jgi:small conductance mechanosensitive channel
MQVLTSHPKVLQTPEPDVFIKNLTDTSIVFSIRPWTNHEDFKYITFDILENCKLAFDAAGINIQPFVKERSISK